MKKTWIFLGILAFGAGGAWCLRHRLPALLESPFHLLAAQSPSSSASSSTLPSAMPADGASHVSGDGRSGTNGEAAGRSGQSGHAGDPAQGRRSGGPLTVRTEAVTLGRLALDVPANGFAQAADTTVISAVQPGLLVEVVARDGEEVAAGALIARLEDRTAQASIAKDQANLASDGASLAGAEAALQRANTLLKQNVQSEQGYEQAKAARDIAAAKLAADQAMLSADQVALEHTEIRAPYAGRLGDITVSPGAYLSAGASLVTITRYNPISIAFRLPQRYLPDLRRGLDDRAKVDADPAATGGSADRGVLSFFDNSIDETSGTVLAKAEFENAKGTLWPGQNVNVTVHFRPDEQEILVPSVSVRQGAEGSFVYTVDESGRIRAKSVTVGRSNDGRTSILSGLAQGWHVVVEGQVQLADGQHVIEQFAGDPPLPVANAAALSGVAQP